MLIFIGFIIAAALGALLRWSFYSLPHPWMTFAVNFLGSFAIGFLFIYLERSAPHLKTWICVAFLGAFTTYSSFSLDIVRLMDQGALKLATVYFLGTNILCIAGCYIGWIIAKNIVTTA